MLNIAARSSQIYAKISAVGLIDFIQARDYLLISDNEAAEKYVNEKFNSKYEESPDLRESLRSKEASEKLQLQLGDIEERFWTILAQIKTSFNDIETDDFVKEIEIAEESIGKLDKEITEIFAEIEKKVEEDLKSICLDKTNKYKYADNPNKNRNEFVDEKMKNLEEMRDSTIQDAKGSIRILDTKIENLHKHLEHIIKAQQYSKDCKLFCSDKICPFKQPADKKKDSI